MISTNVFAARSLTASGARADFVMRTSSSSGAPRAAPVGRSLRAALGVAADAFLEPGPLGRSPIPDAVSYCRSSFFSSHRRALSICREFTLYFPNSQPGDDEKASVAMGQ
jgi:hypothetical protein